MDQRIIAERAYQQAQDYAHSVQGVRFENLQRAIACYETALRYYTSEAFPDQWQRIQQGRARAYSQLVQERLIQTQNPTSIPRRVQHARVPLILTLGLLMLVTLLILAIPLTVIATTSIMRDGLSCVSGTLNIDGSTALQPLIEAMAQGYMQHCSDTFITVGGGASKTGLTDVEQGHDVITDVNVQKDVSHVAERDVPIGIGDSDIFASPVQGDLVDHQVAIGVFVMVLNQGVTGIHNLSTSQIQGIYTGVYQNWRQICTCGPNLPIVPVSRTVNSGTRFTFEKYVLKGVATVPGLGLENTISSSNAIEEVESTSGGIGYTSLYLASQAHDATILSIDGQDPRNFSLIQQDRYKFWNIEHMYTRGQGSPLAQSFIDYISGSAASAVFSHFGFFHLNDIPTMIRNEHVLEGPIVSP